MGGFNSNDYTGLEITSGTNVQPLVVVYKRGTKIVNTITIDSYDANGDPIINGVTFVGTKLNILEGRFENSLENSINDLQEANGISINNLQRTNDLDILPVIDNRFTKLIQSGHTTLLNATLSDINDSGNTNWIMPATSTTLSIVSTSVSDGGVGSGISSLLLVGLDQNFNEIQEVIVTNGTTPVISTLLYRALNVSIGLSVGTPGSGAWGIISLTSTTDSSVWGRYVVDDTTCEVGRWTCPKDKKLIGLSVVTNPGKGADTTFILEITTPGLMPVSFGKLFPSAGFSNYINITSRFLVEGETVKARGYYNSGGSGVRYIAISFNGVFATVADWESLQI